ncbi:AMP-binding enzyme, partial [Ostertagia ostertagi]
MEAAMNFANQMEETILKNNGEPPRSDDVICIVLPESFENHLLIISVHLLGCAYLCLPPDTPPERMQYILADCQAQLVVTDLNLPNISVPILYPQLSFEKRAHSWPRSCSISLAYLIYTSGTTGKPKGVCVSHQSTLNMLKHATRLYGFRPGGRVLQFTKSSFDASISNTFGSLLNGGILSIRDEIVDAVEDLVKRQPIAVVHMTPIIMEMFSEQDLSRLSEVELWSFGGETISESTLEFMIRQGQQLVQLYGPTEATCYQTSLKMKRGHSATCLGLAIPGLPHGLCSFSNPSVERKDLSSQGFIGNPFRTLEDRLLRRNHKVYLVGDKLRRDQNGHLHFLGRNDDQVKLSSRADFLAPSKAKADPRDHVEQQVLKSYREVLQQQELDINSNFFQAGGHSLLAVRLVARLEKSLGLSVPIVKIFEYPHVKDLANWIKGIRKTSTEVDAEEKTKEEKCIQIDEEPSPLQITLLRSFRHPKARALYDLSLSVVLKKAISASKCVEIVNQLIMIHSSLRTRFARNGRSYTREVLSGTECFQNLDAKADLILDPFEKPPFLVCLDADRICVAANHIIIDGHSMQIIVANLAQLLNQQKVPMDEGFMFHSWLLQQFRQCEQDDLQYWKGKLKGY